MYPPSAPNPPVVSEVHTTTCTVTYQHPQYDGDAPVTGYILERRTPGPDSKWIRLNDTPVTDLHYTIDSLTPATDYEFRVAAVNKEKIGNFSPVSWRIMTVERPDKPGRPEVIEVIGTSVHLQWTVPDSNGGADITEYIVKCWTSDETKDITVPADAHMEPLMSYIVRNQLKTHTKYRFAVTAVNKVGQGAWSDVSEYYTTFGGMLNKFENKV